MRTVMIVSMLVVLVALPAMAADVEIATQKIQVNGLVGTIGVAGGLFWPVAQVANSTLQLGPMVAIGESSAVVGVGIRTNVSIDAPVLKNINIAWAGCGPNWTTGIWDIEYGVGMVVAEFE